MGFDETQIPMPADWADHSFQTVHTCTPQPLYYRVCYNTSLDIIRIRVGPQLVLDLFL